MRSSLTLLLHNPAQALASRFGHKLGHRLNEESPGQLRSSRQRCHSGNGVGNQKSVDHSFCQSSRRISGQNTMRS
jgi:hypothetical protein